MHLLLPLASFEDIFPFLIPITIFMIPIVAILAHHQQKMAQIIHGSGNSQVARDEIDALRREVKELKELLNQQTIALDGLQGKSLPPSSVSQRLTEV